MNARRAVFLSASLGTAGATVWLPWWQAPVRPVLLRPLPAAAGDAETWSGWEVLAPRAATLLVVLVIAALPLAFTSGSRCTVLGRTAAAAAGAVAVSAGAVVLFAWGATPAPGGWLALVCGLGAVVVSMRERAGVALPAAIALLAATGTAVTAAPAPGGRAAVSGPFVRLAGLHAAEFRSGTAELRTALRSRLLPVDGGSADRRGDRGRPGRPPGPAVGLVPHGGGRPRVVRRRGRLADHASALTGTGG